MAKSTLLIEMMELLRRRPGVSIEELAATLNRSPRTVYRWLNEISCDLNVNVDCVDGGYHLRGGSGNIGVDLTAEELLALRLSLKSSPFREGSPVERYAESAWRKIRGSATQEKLERLVELGELHDVAITAPKSDADARIVEAIGNAVNQRHRMQVQYRSQSSKRAKRYTIDPYAVVFRRHSWYVLAHSREHGKVVQFRLGRFRSAQETGDSFERPADFSVEEHFAHSWEAWGGSDPELVRVRFSRKVADMVAETTRHHTQRTTREKDGSLIFEVTVSGTLEIASWIMGYGREAEVLEPESLRDYVREQAAGMAAHYQAENARA